MERIIGKSVYKIVSIANQIGYFVISIRLNIPKFSKNTSAETDISNLYRLYIEKVRSKEIFPQREYNSHQIFIDYRDKTNDKLKKEDEVYLISLLKGRLSKWFVPHVLNVMDSFSKEVMVQLIKTAINTGDPSYNNSFLTPATRVFDLEVNDYLLTLFPNSSYKNKMGILRTFYWVRSRLVTTIHPDGTEENYKTNFVWKETAFKADKEINSEIYDEYRMQVNQKYNERIELLLNEYLNSNHSNLKESISWYLPKKIEEYPQYLKPKAERYLQQNK